MASMIFMLIVALVFKICSVKLSSTNQTRPNDILEEYSEKKRKINCRLVAGIILFIAITGSLCLYITGFCHISDESVEHDWVKSSLIGVIGDLVLIEGLIAFFFGLLGSMWGCCGKCAVCFLSPIQSIRLPKSYS